jgi:hypothetical protein
MKNNLAELRSIDIDKSILTAEWEKLFAMHPDYKWIGRNFVDLDFFTPYFKKLILSIEQALGEVPTNLTIQVHEPSKNVPGKAYLTIPHTDEDRLSAIFIPIAYNKMEPILFYDVKPHQLSKVKKAEATGRKKDEQGNYYTKFDSEAEQICRDLADDISQVGIYSEKHPTLVNVGEFHSVRFMDVRSPRIFIQMSYKTPYEKFLKHVDHLHLL